MTDTVLAPHEKSVLPDGGTLEGVATVEGGAAPAGADGAEPARRGRGLSSLLPTLGFVVRRPGLLAAAVWIVVVLLAAFVPALLAHSDPLTGVPADKLQPPSSAHWFGTDQLGRDLYSRVVHGTALTLQASLIAVGLGLVVGSTLGLLAGFFGSWVDDAVMRVADVLLAIPSLLLSLALVTVLGFGTVNVAIAVGLASVASFARIMRSEVAARAHARCTSRRRTASGSRWHARAAPARPAELGRARRGPRRPSSSAPRSSPSRPSASSGSAHRRPAPEWGSLVSDRA